MAAAGPPLPALGLALLEPAGGAYGAGDAVSGQVALELAAPLPVRALRLHAHGRARAAWADAAAPDAASDAASEAQVPYLDVRQDLLRGDGEGRGFKGAGLRGEGARATPNGQRSIPTDDPNGRRGAGPGSGRGVRWWAGPLPT